MNVRSQLPARIETVLFDAGGVLLDLDYAYLRRLLEARRHDASVAALSRAEALARTEIERRVREGGRGSEVWRDYFRIILHEVGFAAAGHDDLIDTLWEAHQRVGLWTSAIPGAREVVDAMRGRDMRLGVVSNAEGQVERDLETAGFGGRFAAVIDSHVVGVEKPDPRIFRLALERLEADAETAIYVGDVPSVDVDGARAAGIAPVLLDRHDLYPRLRVPRLHSIKELPALLAASRPHP